MESCGKIMDDIRTGNANNVNWQILDNDDWITLLKEFPQFADKCDKWQKFLCGHWIELLCSQPQFADKCNCFEEFDFETFLELLVYHPQFADKCDITKFTKEQQKIIREIKQNQENNQLPDRR